MPSVRRLQWIPADSSDRRPGPGEWAKPYRLALPPSGSLSSADHGPTAVPTPSTNAQSAPETSSGYAAFQQAMRPEMPAVPKRPASRAPAARGSMPQRRAGRTSKPVLGAASAPVLTAQSDSRMEGSAVTRRRRWRQRGFGRTGRTKFSQTQSAQTAQPCEARRVVLRRRPRAPTEHCLRCGAAGGNGEYDLSRAPGYTAAQMAVARSAGSEHELPGGAAGGRDGSSMSYSAAQVAAQVAAGGADRSEHELRGSWMAAGVRGSGMSYSAAQLAAAGHSNVQGRAALQPGQQLPSGMHRRWRSTWAHRSMVIVPAGPGRPEGDVRHHDGRRTDAGVYQHGVMLPPRRCRRAAARKPGRDADDPAAHWRR